MSFSSTFGYSAWKAAMMPGSQCTPTLVNVPMRTVPRSRPRIALAVCESCSCEESMPRMAGITLSPSAVGYAPERERLSRAKPSSPSSELIMCDTALCVTPRLSAARVMLLSSTVRMKASYLFTGTVCAPLHYNNTCPGSAFTCPPAQRSGRSSARPRRRQRP